MEKFFLTKDEKQRDWIASAAGVVRSARLTYCYGLYFHAFTTFANDPKAKHFLRESIVATNKVFEKEMGLSRGSLFPLVAESITLAQKLRYN